MQSTTGLIAEITRAFQIANVEMLAVSIPEATVLSATTAALARWNCRHEDVCGKQLAKFGAGSLSARFIASEEEGKQKIEVVYAPPLGVARSLKFTPQTWRDGDREVMILIGQHGSQSQADDAIQNERRLHLALRSGGYAIWDFDYRTGVTTNSPEMYELMGFENGSKELDFNTFNERVHPDDKDKTLDGMICNAPFGADLFQTKYRVKAHSGEYIWIESIAGVIRDPNDGRPSKAVGLCRNISDQMHTLEKVRVSERNLRRSQSAARLGSFVYKPEVSATKLSTELVTLLELDDSVMPPTLPALERMLDPDCREKFKTAMERAKSGTRTTGLELGAKLKSGSLRYFQCNIDPEMDADGKLITLFGTCQCITDRKLLERKFLQAQKMEAVGQLTGGIAHDFNNLLMVVVGNLQLVEQLVKSDERAQKRIHAAIDAAEKGSQLTKRMLAFSRQQQLMNRVIDVNDLTAKNQDILRQAVGGTVELKLIADPAAWPVRADATQLETAILNLCINARDAMKPKGGTLMIETGNAVIDAEFDRLNEDVVPGDYVKISVTDNGCGIVPENIERVFQPFFTTKGPEAGSGLGLSMIYGFVKQSGGFVKIYSEVGHGTTVTLFLPRLKQEGPAQQVVLPTNIAAADRTEAPPKLQEAAESIAAQATVQQLGTEASGAFDPAGFDTTPFGHSEAPIIASPAELPEAIVVPAETASSVGLAQAMLPEPQPATAAVLPEELEPADILSLEALAPKAADRRSIVLVVEDNPAVRDVASAMIEEMGFESLQAASGAEGLKVIEERNDIDLVLSDVIMAGGMNGPELVAKALIMRPELKVLLMSGYAPGSVRQMQGLPATIDLVNKPFTRSDLTEKVKRALAA